MKRGCAPTSNGCARTLRTSASRFRPHLKTAKSLDVARIAMAAPEGPATVSTLHEAEYFAEGGVRDMIYAVGIAPAKLARVSAIRAHGADLAVILDSLEQAEAVAGTSPHERRSRARPDRGRCRRPPLRRGAGRRGSLVAIGQRSWPGAPPCVAFCCMRGQLRPERSGRARGSGGGRARRGRDCGRNSAGGGLALSGGERRLDPDRALRQRSDRRHRGARRRVHVRRPGHGRGRRVREWRTSPSRCSRR